MANSAVFIMWLFKNTTKMSGGGCERNPLHHKQHIVITSSIGFVTHFSADRNFLCFRREVFRKISQQIVDSSRWSGKMIPQQDFSRSIFQSFRIPSDCLCRSTLLEADSDQSSCCFACFVYEECRNLIKSS